MNVSDVKVGVPFYSVMCLGKSSYVSKVTPSSTPFDAELEQAKETLFIYCREETDTQVIHENETISLRDRGIIPNTYNRHQSFLDKREAIECLELAKKMMHVEISPTQHTLDW